MQNNANQIALQSAGVRLANEKNDFKVKTEQHVQDMFSPFQEMENDRLSSNDPNQPKTFADNGRMLTDQQVFSSGHKLTDANVVQDGWRDAWDEGAKRMVPEPTYSIINPDLKNVKLSPKVADTLARVNSQYKDIHAVVGDDVRIPVNAFVSATHDYSAVTMGTEILNQLSSTLGGKPVTQEMVEKAAREGRDGKKDILPTLYKLAHGVGADNMPDKRPDNLLDIMIHSPNGDKALALLGLTPEEADTQKEKIHNKRVSDLKLAEMGGVGDKAPAPPGMVDAQIEALNNSDLPEDKKANLLAAVPETHNGRSNLGQATRWGKQVDSDLTAWTKQKIEQGDPVEIDKTADRYITSGDPSSLSAYFSSRKDVKEKVENALYQKAVDMGVDPTRFTGSALDNKAAAVKDYTGNKKGSTGAQITSFNKVLGHMANAVDTSQRLASKTLGSSRLPIMNTAMDVIGKQIGDDPDWAAFKTSLLPVQQEMSNYLAAGYAPKAEEASLMHAALDPHETPARIMATLKQLADTADIQLTEMGRTYLNATDTTNKNLLSPEAAASLQRLGVKSKAAAFSTELPRGWQTNQMQPLTDRKIGEAYYHAASGDKAKAQWLARQNGWIFQ